MDGIDLLRWILLLIGAVIVVAIYLFGRRRSKRAGRRWEQEEDGSGVVFDTEHSFSHRSAVEPLDTELRDLGSRIAIGGDEDLGFEEMAPREETKLRPTRAVEPAPKSPEPAVKRKPATNRIPAEKNAPEKLITLYLVAPSGSRFRGNEVLGAMEEAGLEYGDMRIFHRYEDTEGGRKTIYSVANLVQPGWFDLDAMADFETPGLALFMQLPGPVDGVRALDRFLETAGRLKGHLGGELLDSTRSVLSKQTASHLREEVQEFCRRLRVPGSRAR
jgi:cell division protein ZipA